MLNNQSAEAKFNCTVILDGTTGVKGLLEYGVFVESQARVDVIGVGGSNVLSVQARIRNTETWVSIKTITGAISDTVDISTYDYIRFNVTTANGIGSANASGFITNLASGGGGGGATAANQVIGNASLSSIDSKTPALVGGKVPVDTGFIQGLTDAQLRATPVPVSGPLTDAQIRATALPVSGPLTSAQLTAAALATEVTAQSIRDRLPSVFQTPNLLAIDSLGTPQVSRVQATTGTAANIALTSTCRRVSMFATQGAWYSISGTATDTSHYVGAGERIDFDVPASTTISVLQETVAGSIRITELL
jgi:hypothetical protein